MQTIIYEAVVHRNEGRITIRFDYNKLWADRLRCNADARWSRTLKAWHITDNEANRIRCLLTVTAKELKHSIAVNGAAAAAENKRELVKSVFVIHKAIVPNNKHVTTQTKPIITTTTGTTTKLGNYKKQLIADVNDTVIPKTKQHLILKGYSPNTIRTYLNEISVYLQQIGKREAATMHLNNIKSYIEYCFVKLKLTEHTIHSRINALKFYYEQVLGYDKFFIELPRPKKPLQLPKLLNEDELRKLFNALHNKKHKALLFTAYSAGLRVSEIVNLKLVDIDSKRMQILIQRAKGKKDRYVNLSPILLDILRGYIKSYVHKPKVYLFESEQSGEAYATRTVQQVFTNAKRIAGIGKEVGVHSLRHSFATHLLDKGTDIRYIKDLLGHFDIRTTERYLHVSKQKLVNIISPLDDLFAREKIDW